MTALAASLREQPHSLWPRFFQIRSGSAFVLSCTASPPESERASHLAAQHIKSQSVLIWVLWAIVYFGKKKEEEEEGEEEKN